MDILPAVEARQEKGNVLVQVRDTGKGLTKEDMEKVFTRFFQADHSVAGTGLGLSICKTIVEAHNGKIWAESEGVGKGTTFTFTLPVKR